MSKKFEVSQAVIGSDYGVFPKGSYNMNLNDHQGKKTTSGNSIIHGVTAEAIPQELYTDAGKQPLADIIKANGGKCPEVVSVINSGRSIKITEVA